MYSRITKTLALGFVLLFSNGLNAATTKLNLDTENITVSGLSSGGYMATQFHIAHSDRVKGAAIIAAGPYYCGRDKLSVVVSQCVEKIDSPIDLAVLNQQAEDWVDAGKIAPLTGLADSKVWLLHGTLDTKVNAGVSDALYQQYRAWIPESAIHYLKDKAFAHLFPTLAAGNNCSESESPYIGQCDYDAAGELLNFLLGDLQPPDGKLEGEVIEFNQRELAGSHADTLAKTGYAFVPKTCANGELCQVHISFHGCNQSAGAIGMAYIENTGFNRWADDNHLVVIYPQTRESYFSPINPQGCWDWWGYSGSDYATRDGEQVQAVKAIIQGLAK